MTAPTRLAMSFAAVLAAIVAAAMMLRAWPVPADTIADAQRRAVLERLPPDEVAAVKLAHAESVPAAEVALFGNSRVVAIGGRDLPHAGSFFNFAVPGLSLRQSIAMLEELVRMGKAPRVAVIGVDYVEIGLPGMIAASPALPTRTMANLGDVGHLLAARSLKAAALQSIEVASGEFRRYLLAFNPTYLTAKLDVLAPAAGAGGEASFGPDGSRPPPAGAPMRAYNPWKRADAYPLLEKDIGRLAALARGGISVVIFETPLFPTYMRRQEETLSANARSVRERLAAACRAHGLTCLGAPWLDPSPAGWADDNHAMPSVLGPWLDGVIAETVL
jgi:hypothetical protein